MAFSQSPENTMALLSNWTPFVCIAASTGSIYHIYIYTGRYMYHVYMVTNTYILESRFSENLFAVSRSPVVTSYCMDATWLDAGVC